MDCKWLEDFLALSQHGNYSQAAAQRHITQPALSAGVNLASVTLETIANEIGRAHV